MDPRVQLTAGIAVLMSAYLGIASTYISDSHTRIQMLVDPPVPVVKAAVAPEVPPAIGHYDLYVQRREGLEEADLRLLRGALKRELGARIGPCQFRSAGESADQPNLGAIVVTVDQWREAPYWSKSCARLEHLVIPTYVAIRVHAVSRRKCTTLDGRHRLNSDVVSLDGSAPRSRGEARERQVQNLVADMFECLPR